MSSEQTALTILYSAALLLQVGGVWLVVSDLREDAKAARRLRIEEAQAQTVQEASVEATMSTATVTGQTAGVGLAPMLQAAARSDVFSRFVIERLEGGRRPAWAGVSLVILGAFAQFAAGLVDTF